MSVKLIEIDVKKRERGTPNVQTFKAEVPVLPRDGDFISSEAIGVSGRVKGGASFWWDEKGELTIEVTIE